METKLIYCASGNARFAQIAIEAGFEYGSQLPGTTYYPICFADQNYKKPDRERYIAALADHRPGMATVMDWEREEQLPEVMEWAEEAAQYVTQVVVIPKVIGGIEKLPRRIGGSEVVLGYSVPTRYGATEVPVWEFSGWPVHLLGGSPHRQMDIARYIRVISADSNYAQKLALSHSQFWVNGTGLRYATHRHWPTLKEADGHAWEIDGPYEAFRRSCLNIIHAWSQL